MDLPSSDQSAKGTQSWPHAPPHRLASAGVYFVTARAMGQLKHFDTDAKLDWFQQLFFDVVKEFHWKLEAWCLLPNHYHYIAHSPNGTGETLQKLTKKLHALSAKQINQWNQKPGTKHIWHNYRETYLTYQASYLARLNYVHQNAVHHKLVNKASDWKWCSAAQFKKSVTTAWLKTVMSFRYEEIAESDGE